MDSGCAGDKFAGMQELMDLVLSWLLVLYSAHFHVFVCWRFVFVCIVCAMFSETKFFDQMGFRDAAENTVTSDEQSNFGEDPRSCCPRRRRSR